MVTNLFWAACECGYYSLLLTAPITCSNCGRELVQVAQVEVDAVYITRPQTERSSDD